VSLQTPNKVRRLQRKLYCKAKKEPEYRFYLLYDKVCREDILRHAYRLVRQSGGAAGADGESLEDIEIQGEENWLKRVREELRKKTYRPDPVKRVMIPKPKGGQRPLGIPSIRDRVVQTAAKLVLEPIFEVDMEDSAYGYRPKRSALDAVKEVHQALIKGYREVVDADLAEYFESIPHRELMRSVARRVSDRGMLKLIKSWLKAQGVQEDARGKRRISGGKCSKRGVPQGGVISPLLANIYMNRFLKAWRKQNKGRTYKAKLVSYADDFVILSCGHADEALAWTRHVLGRMHLSLNESKTRIRHLDRQTNQRFDFLGYTFGWQRGHRDGHAYLGAQASKESLRRLRKRVREWLRPWNHTPLSEVISGLNHILRGWANYFCYGSRRKAAYAIDKYVYDRMRHFLRRRHQVPTRGYKRFPAQYVRHELGVLSLKMLEVPPPA
jgi:RNA-directed DNA polymerase